VSKPKRPERPPQPRMAMAANPKILLPWSTWMRFSWPSEDRCEQRSDVRSVWMWVNTTVGEKKQIYWWYNIVWYNVIWFHVFTM
jgi:hypothetical protein